METTLNVFRNQQSQASAVLDKLLAFLERGQELGIEMDPGLADKLAKVRNGLADQKLKVALIGGFSEGKTSIAAAWMERLDGTSMKISHQESSDEVKVYEVGEDFTLIDTPGLFGFKERISTDTQQIEKYKDITRKYVSEAHLVLYVMNSVNPIKESHRDELTWLFRTLDLLPRTVFVLSRFDEVADVEDDQAYRAALKIKHENVSGRLSDFLSLSDAERLDLSIVAVAANPFDLGLQHWLTQLEQYQQMSRIPLLQQETARRVALKGGAAALVDEAKRSVIRDVLAKQLPVARQNDEKIAAELVNANKLSERMRAELQSARRDVTEARSELRKFVAEYFSGLILQARGVDQQTFLEFYEREIGSEGIMISTRLRNEFEQRLEGVNLEVAKIQLNLATEVDHINSVMRDMGKQGIQFALKGNFINNGSVLAARDGLVTAAKVVGVDLGKVLKFKPWGAVKFAKAANGALVFVGAALELWDSWSEAQREQEFRQTLAAMIASFEEQRSNLLVLLDGEHAIAELFPAYQALETNVHMVQTKAAAVAERRQQFLAWSSEAESLQAETLRLAS